MSSNVKVTTSKLSSNMTAEPAKPAYTLIELTEEQKALALANITKRLGEIVAIVFPGAKPDGRTTEGKSIQAFFAGMDKKASTTETPTGNQELTPEQKAMIDSLLREGRVKSSVELAKLVFPGVAVKGLSREWRAVHAYAKERYPDTFSVTEEPVESTQYEPPDRLQTLVGLVNDFVPTGEAQRKTYNPSALKISDERNLKALMSYMRSYTLKYQASTYDKAVDRNLFLSTFIRWTHDKSDLTQMEQDQMVSAAAERVTVAQLDREIQDIKKYHESIMAGDVVDASGKTKRYGMAEVEQISQTRLRHDSCKGRLEKLMAGLEEARSKRIGERQKRNATLLDLFEAWMTDPEWRADIVAAGKHEKAKDAEEMRRIRTMDDIIALISGQSEEEAAG